MKDIPSPELHELRTVDQLVAENPALTPGGIRWDIFNADNNGLASTGAIIRRGRRVYIAPRLYLDWMVNRSRAA